MAELNEAYSVLSDKEQRKAYDAQRGAKAQSGGSQFRAAEDKAPPGHDPLQKDWRIAMEYYPDLDALEKRLAQFSWKLANTYRAYLLETKQFDPRESLARLMEDDFLTAYFGDDQKIVEFARCLILAKQRNAAQALNNAIRVLGTSADPRRIITRIAQEFDIKHLALDKQKIASLLSRTKSSNAHTNLFTQMLGELGGTFSAEGDPRHNGRETASSACKVEFDGRTFKFPSEFEFRAWFKKEVLPVAERMDH
jgi:curved DNA-binding protein CbpA